MFDHGISREGDLLELGVQLGVLKKSGAFFSYGDIRLGQGRENSKKFLAQNPDLTQEIEQQIRALASPPQDETVGAGT
jgi:recombination protein RecA